MEKEKDYRDRIVEAMTFSSVYWKNSNAYVANGDYYMAPTCPYCGIVLILQQSALQQDEENPQPRYLCSCQKVVGFSRIDWIKVYVCRIEC